MTRVLPSERNAAEQPTPEQPSLSLLAIFSAALAFLSIHTQSIAALAYPYHSSIGFEEWLFAFVWGSLPFKIERASNFGVSKQ